MCHSPWQRLPCLIMSLMANPCCVQVAELLESSRSKEQPPTPRILSMEGLQAWVGGDLKVITAVSEEDAAALLATFSEAAQGEPGIAVQAAAAAAEPFQVRLPSAPLCCLIILPGGWSCG